jgi:hypothetical protein
MCIRSAGAYIDRVLSVLRESHVPLTWMLIQGVIFAGLTMLVTVRTNTARLLQHVGASFLFVEVPNWTRKCSMCMAIMNERWSEDLLSRLDAQFEVLASDTIRQCAASLAPNPRSNPSTDFGQSAVRLEQASAAASPALLDPFAAGENMGLVEPSIPSAGPMNSLDPFGELLGFENWENFWTAFPSQSGFGILESQGTDWI